MTDIPCSNDAEFSMGKNVEKNGILFWKLVLPTVRKTITNFEAEGREFLNFLKSLKKFIQTVEGQNNFENRLLFLAFYWRVLDI